MRTFPKKHALYTARYGVPRSALVHDQLTRSTPQSVTVSDWFIDCLCSRVATPPPPAVSLSLSLSVCVCVDAAVYCTHRQSVGKRPPVVPCWALSTQLWPPDARRTLTHTRHTIAHLMGHTPMSWLGIKLLHHRRLSPTLLSKPACSVFWTTSIASCRSFADLLITCMHPRTFLRARKWQSRVRLILRCDLSMNFPQILGKIGGAAYIQVRLVVRKIRYIFRK